MGHDVDALVEDQFIFMIESEGFDALAPDERTEYMYKMAKRCVEYANGEGDF